MNLEHVAGWTGFALERLASSEGFITCHVGSTYPYLPGSTLFGRLGGILFLPSKSRIFRLDRASLTPCIRHALSGRVASRQAEALPGRGM
jgi:hypothetical protein